jgi:hypothetical protein
MPPEVPGLAKPGFRQARHAAFGESLVTRVAPSDGIREAMRNPIVVSKRPIRNDAMKVRVTTEERRAIETLARDLGLNSGACLLRSLFFAERARLQKQQRDEGDE